MSEGYLDGTLLVLGGLEPVEIELVSLGIPRDHFETYTVVYHHLVLVDFEDLEVSLLLVLFCWCRGNRGYLSWQFIGVEGVLL